MKLEDKALLRALITHKSRGEELYRFLPEGLAEEIQNLPQTEESDFSKVLSQTRWVESVHFSWFADPLKTVRPETQQLFVSLLDDNQADKLCHLLGVPRSATPYSAFMRPFLFDELKRKIFQGVEVLAIEYLPDSTLNKLLFLSKNQLFNLIDLLGVYDLSADLRQVVDKELIGKIHSALSSDQLPFLHYCSKQPIKWVCPKIGLPSWDGTKKTLQRMLHERGLIRLARAIALEDESLKWHLIHRLDIGRAALIEKTVRQKQDVALTPYFKNQVLHIIKRYEK